MMNDVIPAKIGIICGLLVLTLAAALLPLFCVWNANRIKRRRDFYGKPPNKRNKNSTAPSSGGLCGLLGRSTTSGDENNGRKNNENGATGRSRSLRKRMSSMKMNKRQSKRLISCLNCFSGGIFLGASLIGMLPEVRGIFDEQKITWSGEIANSTYEEEHHEDEDDDESGGHGGKYLPLAELVTAAGLFFILSIEQLAHVYNHWRLKRKRQNNNNNNNTTTTTTQLHSTNFGVQVNGVQMTASSPHHDDVTTSVVLVTQDGNAELRHKDNDVSHEDLHNDHHEIRSLMLVTSLSVHGFIEGIAMGLAKKVASLTAIFVAVLFHKSLMAFSMGTNLVRTKQKRARIVAAAVIFALMSPLGIVTGLIIDWTGGEEGVNTESVPNAVFQAIATGTFLYITFFEVLVREFETSGDRIFKVFSLIIGFVSVTLTIYASHL